MYIKEGSSWQLGQDTAECPQIDEDAESEAGGKSNAEDGREFFQKVFHDKSPSKDMVGSSLSQWRIDG